MKKLIEILKNNAMHWVGDGFPVRSLLNYNSDYQTISPFLLFDYAGPWNFKPNEGKPRGVGRHPHRGFETVTIVYDGEVSHRDSEGNAGTIGPGEIQWMTAASGILHEEFHSQNYSKTGGPFRMVQLWVNLPAKDKNAQAKYQAITRDMVPEVELNGGRVRLIAGWLDDIKGPAKTFTPLNLWDVRLNSGSEISLPLPEGHNSMVAVISGNVTIMGKSIYEAEIARCSTYGKGVTVKADNDSMLLVLTGEPIKEVVVGYGPFVMNSESEIVQATDDLKNGKFGMIK